MPSPSPPAPAASQPNPASTPAGVTALLERSVLAFVTAAASSDPMTAAQLRAAYVASVSHALLHTGATMTKRDLYYLCRALFRTSVSADRAVTALARSLGVPSNDLNIVAAPKGIASGPVSWIDESNAHVSVGGFGPAGALIPARPERLRRLRTSASLILVYVSASVCISEAFLAY